MPVVVQKQVLMVVTVQKPVLIPQVRFLGKVEDELVVSKSEPSACLIRATHVRHCTLLDDPPVVLEYVQAALIVEVAEVRESLPTESASPVFVTTLVF